MPTPRKPKTFQKVIRDFIKDEADWLTPADEPALQTLRAAALDLDTNGVTAAMLGQYGLTYRNLMRKKPSNDDPEDEAEEALAGVGA